MHIIEGTRHGIGPFSNWTPASIIMWKHILAYQCSTVVEFEFFQNAWHHCYHTLQNYCFSFVLLSFCEAKSLLGIVYCQNRVVSYWLDCSCCAILYSESSLVQRFFGKSAVLRGPKIEGGSAEISHLCSYFTSHICGNCSLLQPYMQKLRENIGDFGIVIHIFL